MSNEQKTKQEKPARVVVGPGAMLKAAREKSGLTVADIASKLHLKLINIESIEADEFDPAVALTFTKGYLKLYARQVNLTESEVLEAFASMNVEEKEPAKLQSFSKRVAKQANDDRLMMITYAIIAVVAALVVIWWLQQDSIDVVEAPVTQSPVTQSPVAQSTDIQTPVIVDAAASEVENSTIMQVAKPTADDLTISAQFEETTEVEEADVVEAVEDTDETFESELLAVDIIEPISEASLLALNEPEPTEFSDVELIFEFADNCWMNLVDSTGEAIAYGVKKSGRVMTVSGVSPFEVTLGAPQVVSIIYDGVAVDMSRFTPGVTAKFTLPFSE